MECVLHRANTYSRIQSGRGVVQRFEVDVHHCRGAFRLSHDRPIGPFVFGPNGVEFPRHRSRVHIVRSYATLPNVLENETAPFAIDLKGEWPTRALSHLRDLLDDFNRKHDYLSTPAWEALDRYRELDRARLLVYSEGHGARSTELRSRIERGENIGGVSLDDRHLDESASLATTYRLLGLKVYVWNIASEARFRLLERFVDGAIVDDVAWAERYVGGKRALADTRCLFWQRRGGLR